MPTAIQYTEYGSPDVLRAVEVPVPSPGRGQVLLRMLAAGVNPIETKVRSGAMGTAMPGSFPATPGSDIAGVVEELGEGVTGIAAGDEVAGSADGSYAEYALAEADQLAPIPSGVAWEVAGATAIVARTAGTVLDTLAIGARDTLLVHGAAGGVGVMTTQLARARGAAVIGTASEANHQALESYGAVPVSYGQGQFDRIRRAAPGPVTAVLDASGRGVLAGSVDLTGDPDRVVTIADASAPEHGVRFLQGGADNLADVLVLLASDRIRLPIWKRFPLAEAAAAHRESERGHLHGKIVLTAG